MPRGPAPKPPHLRQRRNRTPGARTLEATSPTVRRRVPPLPKRPATENWHAEVRTWWRVLWASPMAAEYLDADVGGLYCLAELYQRRWTEADTKALVPIIAEIRHQEVRFGLTPIDRTRLGWTLPAPGGPKPGPAATPRDATADPRHVLRVLR